MATTGGSRVVTGSPGDVIEQLRTHLERDGRMVLARDGDLVVVAPHRGRRAAVIRLSAREDTSHRAHAAVGARVGWQIDGVAMPHHVALARLVDGWLDAAGAALRSPGPLSI